MFETSQDATPLDWSASYTQYLMRSTAYATKTLELYQQVLRQVSEGRLASTAFQDHLPSFTQARGTTYANQLAELGAAFLGKLVRLNSEFSQTQSQATGISDAEPEIKLPVFDANDSKRWFEQLAEYAGKVNGRAVRLYRAQLERVAAGELTPSEVQQTTSESLSLGLPAYMQNLTGMYFELLGGLNEVRSDYEQDYFGSLLSPLKKPEYEPPVQLHLTTRIGAAAATHLSIANTTTEDVEVIWANTDVRRADGAGPAFAPELTITPQSIHLKPGEEKQIRLSLRLAEEHYEEDVPYLCDVYFSGSKTLHVEVRLHIIGSRALHHTDSASVKVETHGRA